MTGPDALTATAQYDINRAIGHAEAVSGYRFSVFVGDSEGDTRAFARRLQAALTAPDRSVLIMVDPSARMVEVVTGSEVRRDLTDDEVGLAVLSMKSDFAIGGIAGGIIRGLHQLAEQARRPPTLHGET
jgi:hypothetical protein